MTMTLRWQSCSKEDYPHRRHKVTQACHNCRTKKMRCDGKLPCDRCKVSKVTCGYSIKKSISNTQKPTFSDQSNKSKSSSRLPVSDDDNDHVTTTKSYSKRKQQDQQCQPKAFDPRQLKHMSFKHNHYDSMRNSSSISFFGKSRLPPLLFGFFSLTCQPYSIWTTFINLFRQYNNSLRYRQQQTLSNLSTQSPPSLSVELEQEIMSLFGSHNYLYSAFMDMTQVISFLNTSTHNIPDQQNQPSPPSITGSECNWVIINSIFALVFQAASQTLSHHCPDLSPLLQKQSNLFYQRAHHLFIAITYPCFGQTPTTLDSPQLLDLTRASILLTHYQCTTISEEQAYMTLQMGLGYAHRLGLYDLASSSVSSSSSGCNNIKQLDYFKVLQKVLVGWQLWFSIYLHRSQPASTLIPQDKSPMLQRKPEVRTENYLGKKGNQRWTVDVLDVYNQFFMEIVNATEGSCLTLLDIQHHLKQMESWSSAFYNTQLNFTDIKATSSSLHNPIPSSSKVRASQHLPAYILSLYHQTLSIQLLQTQEPQLVLLLSSPSLSSLYTTLIMPSPAPSSPRRDSGIGSHDGQSTLVSTPDGNSTHSLPESPSSQTYSMDAHPTLVTNPILSQVKKEGNELVNESEEIITFDALTHATSVIMDTVYEIMTDNALTNSAPVIGCEKVEYAYSIVVYPLYVVTALLSALTFSARQSLALLPAHSNGDVTQKRQQHLLLQCNTLDQQLSRLSNLLCSASSRLPMAQYLLQFIQDMMVALNASPFGHHHGDTSLFQKEHEKNMENDSAKSPIGVSGLASAMSYPQLHSSLPIRSTLSPTPSSSSSSSSSASVSTAPSMSNFSSSTLQPPSTSTSTSSTSSLTAKTTTAINKLLETSSKPGIKQERQMAIPTMDPSSRLVIDQQQLDKLSLSKGMSSPFTPSYTETASKRTLDSTVTSHILNANQMSTRLNKKFKLTTTPETGTLADISGKIIGNHQLPYAHAQQQHSPIQHQQQHLAQEHIQDQEQQQQQQHQQQTYSDPFSTSSVMTTRYLDQLNELSGHSELEHIYPPDCLTDENLWMAIVGNSSLNAPALSTSTVNDIIPRPKRKPQVNGMHDPTNNNGNNNNNNSSNLLTPKLPLPHIKHKNPIIAKTWQAAIAPINVDWNVCFSAEMNRTLHQNGTQQQPIGIDVATAAAAAASLDQVDPSMHMNMSASTSSNQDNVLYLLSSNIHPSEHTHQQGLHQDQHQQTHQHHQQHHQHQQHHHQQQQRQSQHHQPGDSNYFPASSSWNGVDSSFF